MHGPPAWWRRRLRRRRGAGIGVFWHPVDVEPRELADHLGRCPRLRAWASAHGVELTDDLGALAAIEARLLADTGDRRLGPFWSQELGLYVGTVIITEVAGARWQVDDGYPVVRLASGREVDVIRRVASARGRRSLGSIVEEARRRA